MADAKLLWRSEFRNVLSVYLRQGSFTLPMALEIQRTAQLLMADREFAIDSEGVLRLAVDSGCSAYDAEFVCLAQSEGIPLITSDRALLRQFPVEAGVDPDFSVDDGLLFDVLLWPLALVTGPRAAMAKLRGTFAGLVGRPVGEHRGGRGAR